MVLVNTCMFDAYTRCETINIWELQRPNYYGIQSRQ